LHQEASGRFANLIFRSYWFDVVPWSKTKLRHSERESKEGK
jgi:hypothetical protein